MTFPNFAARGALAVALVVLGGCGSDTLPGQAIFHPGGSQALRPSTVAPEDLAVRGSVYVPVYSSIHWGTIGTLTELSATLSVRNSDHDRPLVLTSVDYFDSLGNRLHRYLADTMELDPMATVEFVIESDDTRGGNGANFIVEWGGTGAIAEPIMEAVMLGQAGNRSISFVSMGREIRVREPAPAGAVR